MPDWKIFADLKSYEKRRVQTHFHVETIYLDRYVDGLLAITGYNIRFIQLAPKKHFWQERKEDDFIGMILKVPLDDVSVYRKSMNMRRAMYIFPNNLGTYTKNTVEVVPERKKGIKLIFSSESEIDNAIATIAQMKESLEELKEKVKIGDRESCTHCGSRKYVPVGPALIACEHCGQEYKV